MAIAEAETGVAVTYSKKPRWKRIITGQARVAIHRRIISHFGGVENTTIVTWGKQRQAYGYQRKYRKQIENNITANYISLQFGNFS